MGSIRGGLLAALAALTLSAPALAAGGAAPGLLKKPDSSTTTVVTTAPAQQQAPAPTTTGPTRPAATTHSNTHATTAPVTKGTVKKLAPIQPAVTPTTSGTSATPQTVRPASRRATHRVTPRRLVKRTQAAHGTSSPAVGHVATPAARRGAAGHTTIAPVGAGAAARATARGRHRPVRAHRLAQPSKPSNDNEAPLASISRAADHVIEVIPGALVLALAGLTALVLVLIMRSWATERTRSKALERSYGVTVEALATAIEAKDHTTGGHIERVRRLGLLLAEQIAPRDARDPQMAYGFLLHDIGKLAIPDAILRAPGRLTDDQWALMRRHPEEGVRMLAHIPFLDRALDVVRHHHERWDGGGYPDGLCGSEIPLWARIFSVVDALDAITADRPYRPGRSYLAALDEISRHAGTQFDPAVVQALEGLDPARIEPLLEPTQLLGELPPELADVVPLATAHA